jgi:hypothetical protein
MPTLKLSNDSRHHLNQVGGPEPEMRLQAVV